MAVYKVPQDVEADDKLIGPFSFRQFVYLIIVAASIALGWGLAQLFIPLAVLPLPIIIFFGALALPLRKDQPMEIYMAAIVSYYLKPRKRLWVADGVQSLVEITAPKVIEVQRTKNLSQGEAEQRLSYLAQIADTQGWAVRGVAAAPTVNSPMNDDLYFEAQQAPDVLDTNTGVGRAIDTRLAQADTQRHNQMVQRMHPTAQPVANTVAPAPTPVVPQSNAPQSAATATLTPQTTTPEPPDPQVTFNPYPSQIHQSVIQPLSEQSALPQPAVPVHPPESVSTSEKQVSPDIINLANNPDLSIETIAREAQRIKQREAELRDEEVVISLR